MENIECLPFQAGMMRDLLCQFLIHSQQCGFDVTPVEQETQELQFSFFERQKCNECPTALVHQKCYTLSRVLDGFQKTCTKHWN